MLSEMTAADANCISYSKQNNIGDEKINQGTLGQKSSIYPKIHTLKISLFTKFTFSKSQFFTKFTFLKSYFSQNSHFQNLTLDKINISNSHTFSRSPMMSTMRIIGLRSWHDRLVGAAVALHPKRPSRACWMTKTSNCRRRKQNCGECKRWLPKCNVKSSNSPRPV